MILKLLVAFIGLAALLTGCSASTGSRYEIKSDTKTENTIEEKKEVVEDFDITPYATEIDIEAPPIATGKVPSDVWYEYN
ncbi:MAG: hypothetical protein ACHQLA_00150, partial [Ignavibacteriales bacterium]